MSDLLLAGRALAFDLASTILFMAVLAFGGSLGLAVGLGIALVVGQIGWERWRGHRIDAMQWTSLCVVCVSGGTSLLTHDPRFVMLKPTILYGLVGVTMLKRGWMMRYLGDDARDYVPDLAIAFGYLWAGMMFASAALNLLLVLTANPRTWAAVMSAWGLGSKLALCLLQFAVMKMVGRRRYRMAGAGMVAACNDSPGCP